MCDMAGVPCMGKLNHLTTALVRRGFDDHREDRADFHFLSAFRPDVHHRTIQRHPHALVGHLSPTGRRPLLR